MVAYVQVLRESVDSLLSTTDVNALSKEGLREILSEGALFRTYSESLRAGMSANSAENLQVLFENFKLQIVQESALADIQPISTLMMPMLRQAWPKIGIKEALPTTAVKVPKFTISYLKPYIIDPDTREKRELPNALRRDQNLPSSQRRLPTTAIALPASEVDIMPVGAGVIAGHTIDRGYAIVAVDMTVTDAAGANPETLTDVRVGDVGLADTRLGSIRFTVTGEHSTGHKTSDTVFGSVDFQKGTLILHSLSASANQARAKVTAVYQRGRIETTNNKFSTQIGYDITTREIHIGTGEHFDSQLPMEWLRDNLAMYKVDGVAKVVDLMTEVIAQKVDVEGLDFIDATGEEAVYLGANFTRTFNVHPTGRYNGSPTDWLLELRRITDNLAQEIKNFSNFNRGSFVILGNPLDVGLYAGVNWIFQAQTDEMRDGVPVDYSIGALSGTHRYMMFTSQNIPAGQLRVFFVPSADDHRTLMYYPYSFNVERSNAGFVSPNAPNVPSIMMTKRHTFERFTPLVGFINILNNNGSLPL